MEIEKIIKKENIVFLDATTKDEALRQIAEIVTKRKLYDDANVAYKELSNRENIGTTGMEDGFAIPHAIGTAKKAIVIVAKFDKGIEWETFDGSKVKIAIALFVPKEKASKEQMNILSTISMQLLDEDFRKNLKASKDQEEMYGVFTNIKLKDKKEKPASDVASTGLKIVGVTSCAAGIAHTFMSAEALEKAAAKLGAQIKVEKQGAGGTEDELTSEDIKNADFVVIASDLRIKGESRFNSKQVYKTKVKEPIHHQDDLLPDLVNALNNKESKRKFAVMQASSGEEEVRESSFNRSEFKKLNKKQKVKFVAKTTGKTMHRSMMTGISYLVPMIVAAGILGVIALLIAQIAVPHHVQDYTDPKTGKFYSPAWQYMSGMKTPNADFTESWNVARLFKTISSYGFDVAIPVVLGGYVAFAIGDKPAIVPGMLTAVMATNYKKLMVYDLDLSTGGFFGGLFAGWVAGGFIWLLKMIPYHKNIKGLMMFFVYPVVGSALGVLLMYFVFAPAAAGLNKGIMVALTHIQNSSIGSVGLGFLVGGLMCIDMGGPINKATLAFGYSVLANRDEAVYAAIAVAKISPEYVTSIATWVAPKLFTKEEVAQGRFVNPILGLTGITEGAIPFILKDFKRVVPATFIGGGITGAVSMLGSCDLNVVGAGVFSAAFMGVKSWIWLTGLLAGSLIGAGLLIAIKKFWKQPSSLVNA